MEKKSNKDYAYTLSIPKSCKETHTNERYDRLDEQNQRSFLTYLMKHAYEYVSLYDLPEDVDDIKAYDMFFEKHADGRLHCHGTIKDICHEFMVDMQRHINEHLGYSITSNRNFHFRIVRNFGWDIYKKKAQKQDDDAERL